MVDEKLDEGALFGGAELAPDLAGEIATEIANLPWARGASVDEQADHHGEMQEIIAKHLAAAPAAPSVTVEEIARVVGQLNHFATHPGCSRALNQVCSDAAAIIALLQSKGAKEGET